MISIHFTLRAKNSYYWSIFSPMIDAARDGDSIESSDQINRDGRKTETFNENKLDRSERKRKSNLKKGKKLPKHERVGNFRRFARKYLTDCATTHKCLQLLQLSIRECRNRTF